VRNDGVIRQMRKGQSGDPMRSLLAYLWSSGMIPPVWLRARGWRRSLASKCWREWARAGGLAAKTGCRQSHSPARRLLADDGHHAGSPVAGRGQGRPAIVHPGGREKYN
jgi:hypothetical protein